MHVSGGELTIDNSYFYNNGANDVGGSVYIIHGGNLSVTSTYFINSTAMDNGGAIFANSGNLNISNSHFADNSAGSLGGAELFVLSAEKGCSFMAATSLIIMWLAIMDKVVVLFISMIATVLASETAPSIIMSLS